MYLWLSSSSSSVKDSFTQSFSAYSTSASTNDIDIVNEAENNVEIILKIVNIMK